MEKGGEVKLSLFFLSVATPNEVRDAGARPEKSYLFFLTAPKTF